MNEFNNYPMGPELRRWLVLPAPSETMPVNEDSMAGFSEWFLESLEDRDLDDSEIKVSLMDELVSMNLPVLSLKLADSYGHVEHRINFRGLSSEGIAAMLVGDMSRAETALSLAQEMVPEEPAPYVNLSRIFMAENRTEEALLWWRAGLDVEHNNHNLWATAHSFVAQNILTITDILAEATKRQSWVGQSLAADLQELPYAKADALEDFYKSGERSPEFLTEYTGTLGQGGAFEEIPSIIWEAENRVGADKMPWKLYLHGAQAHLAMENFPAFEELARKVQKCQDLPEAISQQIDQLISDEKSAQTTN